MFTFLLPMSYRCAEFLRPSCLPCSLVGGGAVTHNALFGFSCLSLSLCPPYIRAGFVRTTKHSTYFLSLFQGLYYCWDCWQPADCWLTACVSVNVGGCVKVTFRVVSPRQLAHLWHCVCRWVFLDLVQFFWCQQLDGTLCGLWNGS